jgi:hypothetical protein
MATNYSGGHSWDHLDGEACSKAEDEIKALRQKLFPYADNTEISGISWDGKYLIGDKASITFFHEMKNRGEQIDVYKRAYDLNLAAKDVEIARLRDALSAIADEDDDGFTRDGHERSVERAARALEVSA